MALSLSFDDRFVSRLSRAAVKKNSRPVVRKLLYVEKFCLRFLVAAHGAWENVSGLAGKHLNC